MPHDIQATLSINTTAIQHNWHQYKSLCGDTVTVSAVVKADAYACGMIPVSKCLSAVGCDTFWVATLDEAITLRMGLKDKTIRIIVLEGIFDSTAYITHNLIGVINHCSQFTHTKSIPCWVHIDTGMNRLGLHHSTAARDILDHISPPTDHNIMGYMTHLHSAESTDSPENSTQYDKFYNTLKNLPKKSISISNSDGVFLGKKYHGDMVRVGIGLYGINTDMHGLQSAVHCTAPIINIMHIPQGETIGYNATYTAPTPMTTATLGIGHNDGIATPYSNCATVYYKDIPCPIVGRVSMDSLCIDISHIKNPHLGDPVTLFKNAKTVQDIHKKTGLPPHMILCTLGERVKKVYNTPIE